VEFENVWLSWFWKSLECVFIESIFSFQKTGATLQEWREVGGGSVKKLDNEKAYGVCEGMEKHLKKKNKKDYT
jgi:hypothetical protein